MRVTAKLFLAVATVLSGLMSVNAVLRVRRETDIFLEDLIRDHRVLTRSLEATLQEIGDQDGIARAEAVLHAIEHGSPDLHLRLIRPEAISLELSAHDRAALLRGQRISRNEGESYVSWEPLQLANGTMRIIEVRESTHGARRYVRQSAVRNASLAAINIVLLAVVIGVLGWWLIGIPTYKLAQKARRVGEGDLSDPLVLPQNDELGDLANAMNAMCVQLATARDDVSAKEAARVVALDQLRHADRLGTLGQMASSLAHELGTPLHVVLGRAVLITEEETTREEAVEHANVIAEQSRRMAGHIRRLLDFSRIPVKRRAPVDLVRVANEAIDLLGPLAAKAEVRLVLERSPSEPVRAVADASQLQQVMANLIVNAVQASAPRQSVAIVVGKTDGPMTPPEGTHLAPGNYVFVQVNDEGRGIEAADLGRIFDPYFTTKSEGEGTGLGLPVVDGIVRDHQGWIDVTSTPGEGTRFTVYLPERADGDEATKAEE